MPSYLGKYRLVRTLGTGGYSKVMLGLDKSSGEYFAIKIIQKQSYEVEQLQDVVKEVDAMKNLKHLNIINLIEFNLEGVVEKSNGKQIKVIYLVLELAKGGNLFDYISLSGYFSEKVARYYFKQLLSALTYVQSQGIVHRDLKPENILFDENFNIKIADFGFAAPKQGKDGSGLLKTKLGTEAYMAPEIHMKKPYSGVQADLFSSAIILFIIKAGHPPFLKAEPSDPYYRVICAERPDLFWKAHSRDKPQDFFSQDFIDLITKMIQLDPKSRLSFKEVVEHNWVNQECSSVEEIQIEFKNRSKQIQEEEKKEKKEDKTEQGSQQEESKQKLKYRSTNQLEEGQKIINDYVVGIRNTEIFTSRDPDEILDVIQGFCTNAGFFLNLSQKKYKGKIVCGGEQDMEINCEILRVSDDRFCLEISLRQGNQYKLFYEIFKQLSEWFASI